MEGWIPVAAEIEPVDWPASSMMRMVCFCAEGRDLMVMVVGNKEAVNCFELRHAIPIDISVCMTK